MKFEIKLYLGSKKVCEGIIDAGMMDIPGPKGNTGTQIGEFTVKWKMLDTKENKKKQKEFIKQYPTPESFYGGN